MRFGESLFESIADLGRPCLFLSPHLDDAVLSAGALISYLARNCEVTIATVFTEASIGPSGRLARQLVRDAQQPDGKALFALRRQEDTAACEAVGASAVHLGFIDAAWRRRKHLHPLLARLARLAPELAQVYPSSSLMWGRVAKADAALRVHIEHRLRTYQAHSAQAIFFCPAGIGGHADHLLARQVCQRIAPASILWADYPYMVRSHTHRKPQLGRAVYEELEFRQGVGFKLQVARAYASQMRSLFNDARAPEVPEVYYVLRAAAFSPALTSLPRMRRAPTQIRRDAAFSYTWDLGC
jgi:LmbE family N-acetylglucosaminyl deacetylase